VRYRNQMYLQNQEAMKSEGEDRQNSSVPPDYSSLYTEDHEIDDQRSKSTFLDLVMLDLNLVHWKMVL